MSFCGFCGNNIPSGAGFCGQCGRATTEPFVTSAPAPSAVDTAPITTVVPIIASSPRSVETYTPPAYAQQTYPDQTPTAHVDAAPPSGRGGAMGLLLIFGLIAVAGGVYLVTKSDDKSTKTPTSTIAGAPTNSDGSSDETTTPGDPVQAATDQLQTFLAQDKPTADSLVGRWIPQLSAKRVGLEIGSVTYGPVEILDDHSPLRATYGAILVDGGAYQFTTSGGPMTGWFLTIVPEPFNSKAEALQWCTERGLNANVCLAREFKPPNP